MRLTPGAVRLSDLVDGVLQSGTVPAPRFRRAELSAANAGIVTVLAGSTQILTLDLVALGDADRVLIFGKLTLAKGATGGQTLIRLQKASGTASIIFQHDLVLIDYIDAIVAANLGTTLNLAAMARSTGGGTCVLELLGQSGGSNSSIAVGGAQLYAWVIPGE